MMDNLFVANIAETIAEQLGGTGRLFAMVGGYNFIATETGFKFHFKGCRKTNIVKIDLDADDTYTVTFWIIKGFDCVKISEHSGIYADMLVGLFERETGLYLNL